MNRIQIEEGFRLTLPKELRREMKVGDEVIVTIDHAGRLVVLSEKRIRAVLQQTAGLWQGRNDIPSDGVKYVNQLRRGRRLRRLGIASHAKSLGAELVTRNAKHYPMKEIAIRAPYERGRK